MSDRIKFTIGTNFDKNLISNISMIDRNKDFISVFGKLKSDFLGGGRASNVLPEISFNELKEYIDLCHKNNLKFNYLINPMCMENLELETNTHYKIIEYIDSLVSIGIDAVTINSPYLCEMIKSRYPNLTITIGLYAYVHDMNLLRRWVNLGADEITLAHDNNRDFHLLKQMLIYTKNRNVNLRLIANNVCLHLCPYAMMHGTVQSHASQKHSRTRCDIDYCMTKCISEKIKNTTNLICSDWIRPEDIHYYEELCESVGNYNLSIKLVERTKNTEFLTRVVKAYSSRKYEGNLLDILLWPKYDEMLIKSKTDQEIMELQNLYNMDEYSNYLNQFDLPDIFIDNQKLDGFLEKFIKEYDCNRKICGGIIDNEILEKNYDKDSVCNYCKIWSDKVIGYNKEKRIQWIQNNVKFNENLKNSSIFKK
ncbi:Peptidase U32 [Fusobacterium necrophorum subsp. funduliforme]|uniref:U32 family peptidase n=1 Tax=Fusobacterium necrophorum TaxID=859 RepID=UPI00370F1818